jgi:hypothetical protein
MFWHDSDARGGVNERILLLAPEAPRLNSCRFSAWHDGLHRRKTDIPAAIQRKSAPRMPTAAPNIT